MDSPSAVGSTSSGWLLALQARQPSAWQQLTQVYGPLVYAWCRWQDLPGSEAADVLQEVFQAVVVHVGEFQSRGPGSFRAWLRTITQNKVHDYFRRLRKNPEAAGGSDMRERLEAVEAPALAVTEETEREVLLHAILERIRPEFSDKTWQAFWQLTVERRPSAEIAADLDMKPEAVR